MQTCAQCRRPLRGPDPGCARCGRAPLPEGATARAISLVARFVAKHESDPWIRSAGLLSYSLRSRRRGFLDDPTRPFTRAALELLHEIAGIAPEAGLSPLAETAIAHADSAPIARALTQLLERHRVALADRGASFAEWFGRLTAAG